MSDQNSENRIKGKGLASAAGKIFEFLSAIRLFFGEIRESVLEKADGLLRRAQYLFMVYLWISIGLIFLMIGIFDLLIDELRVSRGVVFSLGGVLISLVSVIFLQTAKMKKHHH